MRVLDCSGPDEAWSAPRKIWCQVHHLAKGYAVVCRDATHSMQHRALLCCIRYIVSDEIVLKSLLVCLPVITAGIELFHRAMGSHLVAFLLVAKRTETAEHNTEIQQLEQPGSDTRFLYGVKYR